VGLPRLGYAVSTKAVNSNSNLVAALLRVYSPARGAYSLPSPAGRSSLPATMLAFAAAAIAQVRHTRSAIQASCSKSRIEVAASAISRSLGRWRAQALHEARALGRDQPSLT
jgi:hypothetical protein